MSNTFVFKSYDQFDVNLAMATLTDPAISVQDGENKTILTIDCEGKVTWHNEEMADDAADLLIQHVTISLERKAGIVYRRDQWENDIKTELARISQTKELTPEVIDEVFKKHKMVAVLQGKYHNKPETA